VHKRLRLLIVTSSIVAACAVLVGAYTYVFGFGSGGSAAAGTLPTFAPAHVTASTASTTTTTRPMPTTTTIPVQPEPPAKAMPTAGGLHIGDRGPTVLAYEQRLAQLHIDPGPIDGVYDSSTAYAVDAVEKVEGLPRDGDIGNAVQVALTFFKWPKPLAPAGAPPDRVEVSLDGQYLVLYEHNWIKQIVTVSSGGGYAFCGGDSGCQYAVTPPGQFAFTHYIDGWRTSKLGHLYKPFYFDGGIAIHGYPEVPNYPASHGCVRIPMKVADYFHNYLHVGMPVYVVGTPSHALGVRPPTPRTTTTTAPVAPTTTAKTTPTTKKPPATRPTSPTT
jgi:peptidoglycan hydrolase-like protein with peptidoglycan-binding domain